MRKLSYTLYNYSSKERFPSLLINKLAILSPSAISRINKGRFFRFKHDYNK